jgi:hypothetical protein
MQPVSRKRLLAHRQSVGIAVFGSVLHSIPVAAEGSGFEAAPRLLESVALNQELGMQPKTLTEIETVCSECSTGGSNGAHCE